MKNLSVHLKKEVTKRLVSAAGILIVCLSVCVLCSCGRDDTFTIAAKLYQAGRYDEAEQCFDLLLSDPKNAQAPLVLYAHACNLADKGEEGAAKEELVKLSDDKYKEDMQTYTLAKELLYELLLKEGDEKEAATVCGELAGLVSDRDKRERYTHEALVLEERILREDDEHFEEWRKALEKLLMYEAYIPDAHIRLYLSYYSRSMYREMLATADDMAVYMLGRFDYIEDYRPVISVMYDAAKRAEYVEYENNSAHFLELSETFINLAEKKGLSEGEVLKNTIVLNERRGKRETAYALLDVFLNHYPTNSAAIKERNYLKNRLKIAEMP